MCSSTTSTTLQFLEARFICYIGHSPLHVLLPIVLLLEPQHLLDLAIRQGRFVRAHLACVRDIGVVLLEVLIGVDVGEGDGVVGSVKDLVNQHGRQ